MGEGANQMRPYRPGEDDGPGSTWARGDADATEQYDAQAVDATGQTIGDQDVTAGSEDLLTTTSPVDSADYASSAPVQDTDYNYNPALAIGDTIDASGGSAAPQTADETSFAGDAGRYSFTPTSSTSDQDAGLSATPGAGDTDETEAIRVGIEQTRSEMSATIDAIQERLNPQNLVDQAKDTVREATIGRVENMVNDVRYQAREAGAGFVETMKQNPLPTALAAIGIGWLFMKSRNNAQNRYRYEGRNAYPYDRYEYDRYGYARPGYDYDYRGGGGPGEALGRVGDRAGEAAGQVAGTVQDKADQARRTVGDAAGQVKDTAASAASQVRDAAGNVVENVQDKAADLGNTAQYQAQQVQSQFQRTLYENPLAVGAAALVLGAAVGMIIPETEQEHKIMGEARDNVLQKAQSAADQAIDKVSQVAKEAGNAAQQEAQEQGLTA